MDQRQALIAFGADGSYSHEAIVGRMNSDLANNFGNLAQRSLSMVAKNCEGRVPVPGAFTAEDSALLAQANGLLEAARAAFEKQEFSRALEAIWGVLGDTNAYFAEQAPWVLRKTDVERMHTVLFVTLEVLRIVAILVQPVMPTASAALLETLGQHDGDARLFTAVAVPLVPGTELPAPAPIFPKYEEPAEA
jgi:methionyl-tRNA synthetase